MNPLTFHKERSLSVRIYSELLRRYGDGPKAVAWSDIKTQERRMEILTEIGDLRSSKILDFGCGTGHLLAFLRSHLSFKGDYVGYDVSAEMIETARGKFQGSRFELRDIFLDGLSEDFDYVLISGVFNSRVGDNWGMMTAILDMLFSHTRKALAFNALSTYVDYLDPDLFYVDPTKIFSYCKENLSPSVSLRHDYFIKSGVVPYEFTIYVYQCNVQPRMNLSARN